MANIGFHLNKSKLLNGFAPIRAKISVESKARYKAMDKIQPRYWKSNKQRVSPNRETEPYNRHKEINSLLDEYEAKAKVFFNNCTKNNITLTLELVEKFYAGELVFKKNQKVDFNQAFEEFILTGKITKATTTTRTIQTIFNFLKDFQTSAGIQINFDSIDLNLFDSLKIYCFEVKKIKNNYFAKIVATLKSFLNWATDRGYYSGKIHAKFKASEKDIAVIFLEVDEFKDLYNHVFENPKLGRVRDIFCFGCLTGLRFSDLMQLKRDHLQNGHIVKTIQKTKEPVKIPLLQMAKEIISKYHHPVNVLPRISNQKFNDYIKDCCEAAKINKQTIDLTFSGNTTIEVSKPKFELITAHTARKTFVTLSFYLGMDVKTIKSITGHTQDKTFDKYLRIVDEMKKTKMDEAWGKI